MKSTPDSPTTAAATLVCLEGRHVVDELVDVLVADPLAALDLGLHRICDSHVRELRDVGLVVEEVA